ncbi:hypothetical protein Csa_004931 [Cucumis sativus]|uniref:Uncharacterized protein n=1 Tax=Cucumis sativus TaxID=3659 RepID=A0A0A0KAE3_CUCSA|nr:hypothetical protein Csa_004931 [Cucumis sativus]
MEAKRHHQDLYEGLLHQNNNNMDATVTEVFINKTPIQTKDLILTMVANTPQFGTRASINVKSASKVISNLKEQISSLVVAVK